MKRGLSDLIDLTASPARATRSARLRTEDEGGRIPYYLLRLDALPAECNHDTVSIQDIMHGEYNRVILMNYMVDIPWLLGQCPRLMVNLCNMTAAVLAHAFYSYACRTLVSLYVACMDRKVRH